MPTSTPTLPPAPTTGSAPTQGTRFFTEPRQHFFRPLTGKYREQVLECLRALYARLYSSLADYTRSYDRDQVVEIFQEVIVRTPVLEDEAEDAFSAPVRSEREQANWVLNQLLDHGWLERQVDEATLHSNYAFSRYGRLFTQPVVEIGGGRFRTRHRNTRNTRNALQSFLDKGEVYDLLDAFEYSERIIADFSDVLAELDERKRQLVRTVEAQQVIQRALDEFFDFMEKRFMPDLAIRLSADSVEKYRDQIGELITRARRKRKEFKAAAERELRRAAPELVDDPAQSVYWTLLDGIEQRMHNASTVMLPALRKALNGFTRRADIIMRQLSYAGAGHQNRLQAACQRLRSLSPAQCTEALRSAGRTLAALSVQIPDPEYLRLHSGRRRTAVNTLVEADEHLDLDARRALFIQTCLDTAFTFSSQEQRDYIARTLGQQQRIHSQNLPVNDARELLMSAHAIEVGALGSSAFTLRVTPTGNRVRTDYFRGTDEFVIELVEGELMDDERADGEAG